MKVGDYHLYQLNTLHFYHLKLPLLAFDDYQKLISQNT